MTFLSILIALLIERIAPQFSELRQFQWLQNYSLWLSEVLHVERLAGWMGFSIIVTPLLLLTWMFTGMFEHALFGLFELAFGVVVVFFCLGPREMDGQIEQYLDAIELEDNDLRVKLAANLLKEPPALELKDQVAQVCKGIFVESNTRIFSVLFWFAFFGPVAAVLYRLVEQLVRGQYLDTALVQARQAARIFLGIMDWVPARISLFAFMLSGSFDEGLKAYRHGTVLATDVYEQNHELVKEVGYRSINAQSVDSSEQAQLQVRQSRGLVLRSLVVWLLVTLIFGFAS